MDSIDRNTRISDLQEELGRLRSENALARKKNERLQKEAIELKNRIEKLERLLGVNSRNSSMPPSSDPPSAPKRPAKKRRKKSGAKKGHKPHLKAMLPPESVTRSFTLEPGVCPDCDGEHFNESKEAPVVNQYIDIPPIVPEVTEYVRPVRQCANCEVLVYANLPANKPKSCFGSGVLALVAVFTGLLNISKRKTMLVLNEIFNVPISLGGVSNCEKRLTQALEAPYNEVVKHVRQQTVAHADETGWKRGNQEKGWLWTLCCISAAVFMVHARRTQAAARELLGSFSGTLITDRFPSYNFFGGPRQLCWAHLSRDFFAISEAKEELGAIGTGLYNLAMAILKLRARVRDETLQWKTFQNRMEPLMKEVGKLLVKGAAHEGKLGGKCRALLKQQEHLWTFVYDEDVDPTNNHAERMVRQGVLWRKMSFGTQSDRGARYVERVLTACATRRLQGRSVVEFLRGACQSHIEKLAAPSLIV